MFSVKCGLIVITRGDTGLITVEPRDGYTPTPKDRAIFTVAQMPGAKTVISKVVTPDESGVVRIPLMSADTNDLPRERQCEYTWSLRYALDAVMTGDTVTGWREMITPIPAGQFVVLEANDFPSGVSCPEDERLPVKIESLKGERGEQGERGERGEKGEKGNRGEKGERGERGIQGAQGEKGDALRFDDLTIEQKAQLKGERGERGEKGEQGERGERGVQGIQGATGAQGRQGDTGLRGAKGDPFVYADFTPEQLAALKGEPGKDGAPGEPGKDAPQEAVLFIEQTLDEAQKAQARANIGAADAARQNALVGSETGNPITVDDAFAAPLRGLTVYGRSTQDGTPTPDAPVPIVSAGDGGSVVVKVTGKNQMPPNLKYGDVVECFIKKNTPIALVFKGDLVSQGGNILFFDENGNENWFGIDKGKAEHYIKYTVNLIKFQYLLENMVSENVCLTWNASSPDYEPYHEQLLTLPTPTGLPGIPVTSGGNYTDSTGQQWVCDEVDLEKGVMVQRVNAVDLSTCTITGTTELAVTKRLSILLPIRGRDYKSEAICSRLRFLVSFTEDTPHFYVDVANAQVFIPIGAKNPEEGEYILFYALATPIETPLTPAEIAAYKALTAYAPDTVVQVSDGAGLKLDYQRDVNIVIKNLEDAIASMTTT